MLEIIIENFCGWKGDFKYLIYLYRYGKDQITVDDYLKIIEHPRVTQLINLKTCDKVALKFNNIQKFHNLESFKAKHLQHNPSNNPIGNKM